jgi:hypothetical protein
MADMSDSMAPRSATVMADGRREPRSSGRNAGTEIRGSPLGMPPNRDPIVSTGRAKTTTARVDPTSTTIAPGTFLHKVANRIIVARATGTEDCRPEADIVGRAARSSPIRGRNAPEECAVWRPRKSRICVLAMTTAMPFVKPTTTGRGM